MYLCFKRQACFIICLKQLLCKNSFVYLQEASLSQGQLEFFCWQMYSKWGKEKYFYSGI